VSYLLYLRVQGHAVTRIAWSSAQAGGVGPVRRTPSRRLKIKAGASDTPSCSGESSAGWRGQTGLACGTDRVYVREVIRQTSKKIFSA
jgi:hypothetical protein